MPAADDLTITVGLGASMFDDRYGLADRSPTPGRDAAFPNDRLAPERTHGDLLVQICGGSNETCIHALRRLMRATRDSMVVRWMVPGFNQPNTLGPGRTSTRNLLGFKDGTANLDPADDALMDELVWVQPGDDEPEWAAGGTLPGGAHHPHAGGVLGSDARCARRRRSSGARRRPARPSDGATETDVPDFAADPDGTTVPPRRPHPPGQPADDGDRAATGSCAAGFSYSLGFDSAGHFDQGLLFQCFQRDLTRASSPSRTASSGEALEEYITPGRRRLLLRPARRARTTHDWYGRALLS